MGFATLSRAWFPMFPQNPKLLFPSSLHQGPVYPLPSVDESSRNVALFPCLSQDRQGSFHTAKVLHCRGAGFVSREPIPRGYGPEPPMVPCRVTSALAWP